MPHNCCISDCKNNVKKGYRLFKIPRDVERKQIWLNYIARPNLHYEARICECHFSDNQFETKRMDNKKLLKSSAVPDVLCARKVRSKSKYREDGDSLTVKCSKNRDENHITGSTSLKKLSDYVILNDSNKTTENVNSSFDDASLNDSNDELRNKLLENRKNMVENLKKTVELLLQKRSLYEKQWKQKQNTNLEKIFNSDQLEALETGKRKGTRWSDDTVTKGLKLYTACGTEGYRELLRQNMPYPAIRTLQHRLRDLNFKPGRCTSTFKIKS